MIYYFAYGSNMDADRIIERLGYLPKFKCGVLEGYTLKFNKVATTQPSGVGYANIVEDQGGRVEGIIFHITEDDLRSLDVYEGVRTNHYKHITLVIKTRTEECEVIGYIALKGMINQSLKPTAEYLNHLLKGKDCMSDMYFDNLKCVETYEE